MMRGDGKFTCKICGHSSRFTYSSKEDFVTRAERIKIGHYDSVHQSIPVEISSSTEFMYREGSWVPLLEEDLRLTASQYREKYNIKEDGFYVRWGKRSYFKLLFEEQK